MVYVLCMIQLLTELTEEALSSFFNLFLGLHTLACIKQPSPLTSKSGGISAEDSNIDGTNLAL